MAANREDIKGMWSRGLAKKATHMIVVCDAFDHEDYPVFVMPGEDAREKVAEYDGKNMQRIMEVYNFSIDLDEQLKQHRAFNY